MLTVIRLNSTADLHAALYRAGQPFEASHGDTLRTTPVIVRLRMDLAVKRYAMLGDASAWYAWKLQRDEYAAFEASEHHY